MYNRSIGNSPFSSTSSATDTTADTFPVNVRLPVCVASDHKHDDCQSPCEIDSDHWAYALKGMREKVYNDTAVSLPSPSYHLLQYEKRCKNNTAHAAKVKRNFENSDILGPYFYNFNSDPLAPKDMFDYRALRSEHLLIRLAYQMNFTSRIYHTIVRLAKGRFLVQQYDYVESPFLTGQSRAHPNASMDTTANTALKSETTYNNINSNQPSSLSADPYLDFFLSEQDDLTMIDTFTFDSLFQSMFNSQKQNLNQPSTHNSPNNSASENTNTTSIDFLPFTYTIGVRYTHPYQGVRDILIRGRIPDWCRTLIITECMRNLPIKPGMTLSGLLPFAKDLEFHFRQLSAENDPYVYPDMLVCYERMTMDLCWPRSPFSTDKQPIKLQEQHQTPQPQPRVSHYYDSHQPFYCPPPPPQHPQPLSMFTAAPTGIHYQHPLYAQPSPLSAYHSSAFAVNATPLTSTNPSTVNSSSHDDSCYSHSQLDETVDESTFTENILNSVAMCDIPDQTAALITDMATEWVASQQKNFSSTSSHTA